MSDVIVKIQLDKLLLGLLGRPDLVEHWWHTPNLAFGERTPIEIYRSGEHGRQQVKNYILQFCV